MFDWIVGKLNDALGTTTTLRASDPTLLSAANWMGLLDVFGFEIFTTNGFEQLMVNLANERLQVNMNHTPPTPPASPTCLNGRASLSRHRSASSSTRSSRRSSRFTPRRGSRG